LHKQNNNRMTQTLPQYQNKAQAKRMTGLSYLGGINTSSKIKKRTQV